MLTEGLGWFIYLFGYELLFRGILLFPLVAAIGVWPAIGVNIALYSATHIPKGVEETIDVVGADVGLELFSVGGVVIGHIGNGNCRLFFTN